MSEILRKEMRVLSSMCDSAGVLGIPETFSLFMDIAALHAEELGCGVNVLGEKGLFWVIARSRVRFFRRPRLMEEVTLETWPEPPARLRANRDYALRRGEEILALGKTEWAVLEGDGGRPRPPAEVFPPALDYCPDTVWPEPFSRLRDEPLEELGRYAVRSTDIDLEGHMNNVAYLRAMESLFTVRDWQAMEIRELEIAYRSSCHEGDTLIWQYRREPEGGLTLRAVLEDGRTICLSRLLCG